MPVPPSGFILISGGSYFNPSTGTYWMAPSAPGPAPVAVTAPAPSAPVSSSPFERPVTSYPATRTEISTGKVEYAAPGGGWVSKDPGPTVTTRAPAPSFTRESGGSAPVQAAPKPTVPADSFTRLNQAALRPEVVEFIATSYPEHLAYTPPGSAGHEDYMKIYNNLAPGLPVREKQAVINESLASFAAAKGYQMEDVKEYSVLESGEIAGFTTLSGINIISGEVAGKYNLKSERGNPLNSLVGKDYPFPIFVNAEVPPEKPIPFSEGKSVAEAQAEKTLTGTQFGIGAGFLGVKAAKDLFGRNEEPGATIKLEYGGKATIDTSAQDEYWVNPAYISKTDSLRSLPAAIGMTVLSDKGRAAIGRMATTEAFEFTKGVGALAGTAIDVPVQSAKDAPGVVSYVQKRPIEAAVVGGTAFIIGFGSSTVAMGQDVVGSAQGQPGALGRTVLNIGLMSTSLLPKLGKGLGTSNIELVNPGSGLRPTQYGIFKAGAVGTTPVGTLYNRPLANVKAPAIVGKAVEKAWFPEKIMTKEGYAYSNPVTKLGAGRGEIGGPLSTGVVSIGKVKSAAEDSPINTMPNKVKPELPPEITITANEVSSTKTPSSALQLRRAAAEKSPLGGKAYDFKGTLLEERAVYPKITIDKPSSLAEGSLGGNKIKLFTEPPKTGASEPFTSFRVKGGGLEQRTFTTTELGTGNLGKATTEHGLRTVETEVAYGHTPYTYTAGQELPQTVVSGKVYVSGGKVPGAKIESTGGATLSLTGSKQIGLELTKSETATPFSRAQVESSVFSSGKTTSYYQNNPSTVLSKGARIEDYLGQKGGQFTISGRLDEAVLSKATSSQGIKRMTFDTPRQEMAADYKWFKPEKQGGLTQTTPRKGGGMKNFGGGSGSGLKIAELEGGGTETVGGTKALTGTTQKTVLQEVSLFSGEKTASRALTLNPTAKTATATTIPKSMQLGASATLVGISQQRTGTTGKAITSPHPITVSKTMPVEITRSSPIAKTVSITRALPLERIQPVEQTRIDPREKTIPIERTWPIERIQPVEETKMFSSGRTIFSEKTRDVTTTKDTTIITQLTRIGQGSIDVPHPTITIPVIPIEPGHRIDKKSTTPPPPFFPGLPESRKNRSRNYPSMGAFGKKGKFKFKRGLQPLLQPFEQLRIELKTGKGLSAYVPSTPKTRAIYAKNQFGAFGKSGLEGMFKTKKKRR
jgi:hypothetical protein